MSLSRDCRGRLLSFLIPAGSGKTYLCKRLSHYHVKQEKDRPSEDFSFLDVDDYIKTTIANVQALVTNEHAKEMVIFPKLRDDVIKMLGDHPKTTLIIITSNCAFIRYLGIKPKRLMILIPSTHMFSEMLTVDGLVSKDTSEPTSPTVRFHGEKKEKVNKSSTEKQIAVLSNESKDMIMSRDIIMCSHFARLIGITAYENLDELERVVVLKFNLVKMVN